MTPLSWASPATCSSQGVAVHEDDTDGHRGIFYWRPPIAGWDYTREQSGGAVTDSDVRARIEALETQVQELKSVQDLLMRLLATTRPLASMLAFYGGTETTEHALYGLLDELAANARGPKSRQPTFSYFQMRLEEILPALRGDRVFIQTLIDTLKADRPAYRDLHAYMVSHRWPKWD